MRCRLVFRFQMLEARFIGLLDGKKGDEQKKNSFCAKAIEFLELMKTDPKNEHRKGELDCCIDELRDYFMGENIYNTTEEQLIKYYDAFIN